jgi:LEA14-like dessication related protein
MPRRPFPIAAPALLVALGLTSATAACGLHGQFADLATFAISDFRLRDVDEARLAGVNVRDLRRPSDLGVDDAARVAVSAATGTFPLELRLTLESENRSDAPATIRQFDWKLRLDDVEVAAGLSPETIELPARGLQTFPFEVRADLRDWLRERSRDAIADLAVGLFDPDRRQARVVLAISPTFEIFGRERRMPFVDVPIRVPRVVGPRPSPGAPGAHAP